MINIPLVINEDSVKVRTTDLNYKELSLFSLIQELGKIYKNDTPINRIRNAIAETARGALKFIPNNAKKKPRSNS